MMKKLFEHKWVDIPWVILIAVALICTFFFAYGDQLLTVGHSIIFWENLLKGNPAHAYQNYLDLMVSEPDSYLAFPMAYSAISYFILGIINLPLIILHMTNGLSFKSFFFNCYVEIEHVVMLLLCVTVYIKICKEINFDEKRIKEAVFLFVSSVYILCFVLVIGQMEIYATFFSLLGLLYWLRKRDVFFVLFFAIAIPLKLFALFIFIPLLLIREKNICKIILRLIGSISFFVIEKLIFSSNDAYRLSTKEPGIRMLDTLKNSSILGGMLSTIPVFVVVYALFCIFVYCRKKDDDDRENGIYYCFLAYSLVFIFLLSYPYWIVIITPFIPILIIRKNNRAFLILVEMITSVAHIFLTIIQSPHILSVNIIDGMVLPLLKSSNNINDSQYKYASLMDIIKEVGLDEFGFVFVAVFVAGTITLLILLRPGEKELSFNIGINEKCLTLIRPLVIVPFAGLLVMCYYGPREKTVKDGTINGIELCGWNLFSDEYISLGDNAIVQKLHFDNEYDLNEIDIMFQRNANLFYVYGSVTLKLINDSSGEIIYSKRMGYNELKMGDYTRFKLKNILVNSEDDYSISISADYPQTETLQIYCSSDDVLPNDVLYYGDELVGKDLGMIIKAKAE